MPETLSHTASSPPQNPTSSTTSKPSGRCQAKGLSVSRTRPSRQPASRSVSYSPGRTIPKNSTSGTSSDTPEYLLHPGQREAQQLLVRGQRQPEVVVDAEGAARDDRHPGLLQQQPGDVRTRGEDPFPVPATDHLGAVDEHVERPTGAAVAQPRHVGEPLLHQR